MIELTRDGDVRILTMDEGENRFNRDTIAALHAAVVARAWREADIVGRLAPDAAQSWTSSRSRPAVSGPIR